MAGDWIPVRVGLAGTREVLQIAAATGRDRHLVAGLLVDFWGWASNESADGTLPGVTIKLICATIGGTPKVWQAVAEAGWLIIEPKRLIVPNWQHWLSGSAKERLQDARRKRASRAADGRPNDGGNSPDKCPDAGRTDDGQKPGFSETTGQDRTEDSEEKKERAREGGEVLDLGSPFAQGQSRPPPLSQHDGFADMLFAAIREHKPDFVIPENANWSLDIRDMIGRDGRKPSRIAEVIRWATRDPHWRAVILSAAKLREHFDQLEIRMSGEGKTHGQQRDKHQPPKQTLAERRAAERAKFGSAATG